MFEEIRHEYHIDRTALHVDLVGGAGMEFDIGPEIFRRVRIEVDGVLLLCPDIVDELAVAAGKIEDNLILADQSLEIVRAQRLPDRHFLRALALAETEAIERGEIGHDWSSGAAE